ncbi:DUF2339 domain-containing protein [Sphingomonas cynarae]|uniref:DUF2339 domain-containing protein n=1 Tax=Sphingomonas cynarae TaxID=930197 RepID=A0ABP7EVB4_9SPHN
MILWSALLAALVGWVLAGYSEHGLILGGIVGALVGWAGRRMIRMEVATATAPLQAQIDLLATRLHEREESVPAPASMSAPAPMPTEPVVAPADPFPDEEEPVGMVGFDPAVWRAPPGTPAPAPATPAPVEPTPVAPAEPGLVEAAIARARDWLLGGNTIVRLGLVVLFVGLSFLASYAAAAGLFPIEFRLAVVAAIGVALLVTGFRTRTGRPGFGLALQGGGVAILYLTLFAAAKLYDTVPVGAAFALMIVVCAAGCALALLQRSQALALTAFAGGFAVPLLLSDGTGDVVGLFAYYTLLNLAILFIAGRRSWRLLNLLGFLATFGVMTLWEAASYQPADFAAGQVFLIVSVLIYVATGMMQARATPGRFGNVVDTTLSFGPALAGFGLQVGLVHNRPFGSAFAALGFAALYLGIAAFTMRHRRDDLRVMNETMLAIGIGFVTLAVPLALGARWTSAVWALEGAGAVWVGMRQARWMPRLFGLLLQSVAALLCLIALNVAPLVGAGFVGPVLIALALGITAWWLRMPLPHSGSRFARGYARIEAVLGDPAFLVAFGFWWLAWAVEAGRHLPPVERGGMPLPVFAGSTRALLMMLAYVGSAWGAQAIGRRLRWPVAGWPARAALIALAAGFVAEKAAGSHVLSAPDWAIWAVSIALHLHMLHRIDRDGDAAARQPIVRAAHAGGVWLGGALAIDSVLFVLERTGLSTRGAWEEAALLTTVAAILAGLTRWTRGALQGRGIPRWPLARHETDYGWYAALPVAALLVPATLLVALFSSGSADPLPYVPPLNPADLSVALALATLEWWRRAIGAANLPNPGAAALGGRAARGMIAWLAFVAVNTVWLRIAHHLLGVAWDPGALLSSFVVQTGLAILWTLVALALMVVAHRRMRRTLWLIGAALLGLTVVKLLLIDMNGSGGGARIVAFIVVGLLMLVVGYLAPLPPKGQAVTGEGR